MSAITTEQLEEFKKQIIMLIANNGGNSQQSQNILDAVKSQQKMDMILMLAELLEIDNLDFITEHPNLNWVKQITKFETLRSHQAEHFDLNINSKWDADSMDKDEDKVIKPMIRAWKLNMISHKRKRPQEIIQGLKQEAINYNIGNSEGQRRKKILGLI